MMNQWQISTRGRRRKDETKKDKANNKKGSANTENDTEEGWTVVTKGYKQKNSTTNYYLYQQLVQPTLCQQQPREKYTIATNQTSPTTQQKKGYKKTPKRKNTETLRGYPQTTKRQ